MRVVVIGGTGHIGTYLTPRLAENGHSVLCVSRGLRSPYRDHAAWRTIENVLIDRASEEAAGSFGERIASLDPEVVIDLTCYKPESAELLTNSLLGRIQHFLHCGTIWVHGHSSEVPTTERAPRAPFGDYGISKASIEAFLLRISHQRQFPVTILHPGHLVGTGWNPLNPQGNFNPEVFSDLVCGKSIRLPNFGMETVHHVHADDVAQSFLCAMTHRSSAIGESFHIVAPTALTLRGFAEKMARWFGHAATFSFLPWEEWKRTVTEKDASATFDHIAHSPNCSISKARTVLDFRPGYTSLEAVQEAVIDMQRRRVVSET